MHKKKLPALRGNFAFALHFMITAAEQWKFLEFQSKNMYFVYTHMNDLIFQKIIMYEILILLLLLVVLYHL